MVAIERTAYPRFKRTPTAKELAEGYSLTEDERRFVQANRPRPPAPAQPGGAPEGLQTARPGTGLP